MIPLTEIPRIKINSHLPKLCNYIFTWIGHGWNTIHQLPKEIEVENDRSVTSTTKGIEKGWLCQVVHDHIHEF